MPPLLHTLTTGAPAPASRSARADRAGPTRRAGTRTAKTGQATAVSEGTCASALTHARGRRAVLDGLLHEPPAGQDHGPPLRGHPALGWCVHAAAHRPPPAAAIAASVPTTETHHRGAAEHRCHRHRRDSGALCPCAGRLGHTHSAQPHFDAAMASIKEARLQSAIMLHHDAITGARWACHAAAQRTRRAVGTSTALVTEDYVRRITNGAANATAVRIAGLPTWRCRLFMHDARSPSPRRRRWRSRHRLSSEVTPARDVVCELTHASFAGTSVTASVAPLEGLASASGPCLYPRRHWAHAQTQ
jgi:hypothetical protein